MIQKLQTFVVRIVAGANIATILLMLLIGYSDRLNPVSYPLLSTFGLGFPIFMLLNLGFLLFWVVFKFRWVVIPVTGFIICFGPIRTYMPLNFKSEPPADAIKMMTWNIWNLQGWEDKSQPNPVYEYIARQNADIVCLQEAHPKYIKQKYIDERLSAIYPYMASSDSEKKRDLLVLLSKYPIVKQEEIAYESNANHSTAFYIKMGTDTVLVVNNHLESSRLTIDDRNNFSEMVKGDMERDSARQQSKLIIHKLSKANVKRAPEADAVAEYASQHAQYRTILCGDFNDGPISYAHHRFTHQLQDCFIESGRGLGFTFHHYAMHVRIDHIFASHHWVPYACYVDSDVKLSDHYPVISWLQKSPKP